VWKENFTGTGGGISEVFPVPDFQADAALPPVGHHRRKGRGVRDVAAAAASVPGYRIILDGNPIVKDGTSAVAPLWAAMIALANARRGAPLRARQPILYGNRDLFRPITVGDNRVGGVGYDAAPGRTWNACTGLGVPKGAEVIAARSPPRAPPWLSGLLREAALRGRLVVRWRVGRLRSPFGDPHHGGPQGTRSAIM